MPDEVASIQFHEVSDRAVTVRWTPPKQANGVLTGYQLTYMVTDKPDTLRTENLTADTLSLKVEHLQVKFLIPQSKISPESVCYVRRRKFSWNHLRRSDLIAYCRRQRLSTASNCAPRLKWVLEWRGSPPSSRGSNPSCRNRRRSWP